MIRGSHVQYLSDMVYYPNHPLHDIVMTCLQCSVFNELAEFCLVHHSSVSDAIIRLLSVQYSHKAIAISFTRKLLRDTTITWFLTTWSDLEKQCSPIVSWRGRFIQCTVQAATVYRMVTKVLQTCVIAIPQVPPEIWYIIVYFSFTMPLFGKKHKLSYE